jgi:hypothetical protein
MAAPRRKTTLDSVSSASLRRLEELIDRMIGILRGVEANDPTALSEALELASTHPRLVMPDGYEVPTYQSLLC